MKGFPFSVFSVSFREASKLNAFLSPPKRNALYESKRRSFLQFFRKLFAELYFFVVISHGFMLISTSLDSNIVYEGVSSEPKNSFWNILLFKMQ